MAKANEVAEEVVSSMRTVRSFANESDEVQRYDLKLMVTKKLKMKEAVAYAGYIWSNEVSASERLRNVFSIVVILCVLLTLNCFKSFIPMKYLLFLLQLFALSLIVATLYYGGHLVVNDELSGGDLVSFILYQMELGFALEVSDSNLGYCESYSSTCNLFYFIHGPSVKQLFLFADDVIHVNYISNKKKKIC